jgi:hypothetical protein
MRKFALMFFTLFLLKGQSPEVDNLRQRVFEFEKHYDKFFRKLFGCPEKGAIFPENCNSNLGVISVQDYNNARKASKKLFD